jgi:hypothetical protein
VRWLCSRQFPIQIAFYSSLALRVVWINESALLFDRLASSNICFLECLIYSARCSGLRLDSFTLKKSSSLDFSLPLALLMLMFDNFCTVESILSLLWGASSGVSDCAVECTALCGIISYWVKDYTLWGSNMVGVSMLWTVIYSLTTSTAGFESTASKGTAIA